MRNPTMIISLLSALLITHTAAAQEKSLDSAGRIIDQSIEAAILLTRIREMNQALVEEVRLFDVFQGEPVPQNRKSVSLRIIYRSATQTLEDDQVNQIHKEITDRLVEQFKADLPA